MRFESRVLLLALSALLTTPAAVTSQVFHVGAGWADYDLAGAGREGVYSGRYAHRIAGPLHFEGGVTVFNYEYAGFLFSEFGLVLRAEDVVEELSFYLATGSGMTIAYHGGSGGRATLHAAGGFELRPDRRWGIRGELRLRTTGGGHTADITFGPTFRM